MWDFLNIFVGSNKSLTKKYSYNIQFNDADITAQSILPDDNDDKVKDVVFVTEVFPLKCKQFYGHLHSKYNGEDYVTDL